MKTMKKILSVFVMAVAGVTTVTAAVLDDVRSLIDSGDYRAAMDMAAPVLKRSPRDAKTNYWYGRAALGAGDIDEALRTLSVAAERGYTDAYAPLIKVYLNLYDVDSASESIDSWRTAIKKARRTDPAEIEDIEAQYVRMSNALARVENIPVIAEYTLARSDIERLLDDVNSGRAPKGTLFAKDSIPFFINNMTNEVFRTRKDSTDTSRLYVAGVLDDGTLESPADLTEYIGEGDIVAPFVMEDGETVYFGARRDDSLGGYDIYMTRRDGDGGFYEPTNIGMPYNSPDNDYLYVVNERIGLGWWITDRDADPDSVRVLVFVPNTTRVNIDAEADDIVDRARLDDISTTIPDDYDIAAAKARIPTPGRTTTADIGESFRPLSLGNGRVITAMSEFRNPDAAAALSDLRAVESKLDKAQSELAALRLEYGEGNTNIKGKIRALEAETSRLAREVLNARNRVIRLETSRR